MKITEIITEANNSDVNNDGIPDSQQTATPGMRSYTNLNNSDPYHPWRFGAMFLGGAGAPDGKYEHEPAKDGPNGQSLVISAYSEGELAILAQAAKAFGAEAAHLQLTPNGSTEVIDVNKTSIIRKVGPITRIEKTTVTIKK
jgi:hypothetical protein